MVFYIQAETLLRTLETLNEERDMLPDQSRRAAIYARIATSQERDTFALASQIEQCRAYCQEHSYTVEEAHIYSEEKSGKADYHNRSQLAALIEAAQQREFETVVISAFDRLSRDHAQVTAIIDELQGHSVTVEGPEGPAELAAMTMAILDKAEETQRRRIAERSRYARATKRQGENH
jgi:DNA invertase Pin-like site-specific DNA recombinase